MLIQKFISLFKIILRGSKIKSLTSDNLLKITKNCFISMKFFYLFILIYLFCPIGIIDHLEAKDIPHKWLEVPKSEYGLQVWDELSLKNNKDGSIRILSKYIPNVKNDITKEILYTMDINCSNETFRDVSLGQNDFDEFENPNIEWKNPNGDKLISGVIDDVCKFNTLR